MRGVAIDGRRGGGDVVCTCMYGAISGLLDFKIWGKSLVIQSPPQPTHVMVN